MPLWWAIAPCPSEEHSVFDHAWAYDVGNGVIAIGWNAGDVSGLSRVELEERIRQVYPNEPMAPRQVSSFFFDIEEGDYVVARRGRKIMIGVGTVTRTAYFDAAAGDRRGTREPIGTRPYYPHFLGVEWHDISPKRFPHLVFPIRTVARIRKRLRLVQNAAVTPKS